MLVPVCFLAAPHAPPLQGAPSLTLPPPGLALQVRALAAYLQQRRQQGAARLGYEAATVTAVLPVGMGDRACVDLCRSAGGGRGARQAAGGQRPAACAVVTPHACMRAVWWEPALWPAVT